ncbi:MAG TPA: CaiB/BaiF CoA-transferase family protein [Bacteroidia bacterium]|nr:CaiB/BaiF CoA-transferase family protein [Bacteroidia bacterium]
MPEAPFKDLRVIELAGVLAGPSLGFFFAELGAQVIKIENPNTDGDVTRHWKLKNEDPSGKDSAYFWAVNAQKKIMRLDLQAQSDLARLYELVRNADLCITNFKPGDEVKLKVDYASLSALNPRLIYASINGFGEDSARIAYDLILQAESGFMAMNGSKPGEALKMPVALIDLLAAHQLKEAVLIALLKRYRDGQGSHVSVSLFRSAIASLANQATNWLIAGHLPQAAGSLHPNIAPYGELFETRDHQLVTFAIGSNRQFGNLCELILYHSLSSDKRFATNQARVQNRQELYSILYDYIRQFDFQVLYTSCLKLDIPIGKIRNLKEVFDLPESREMLRTTESGGKTKTYVSGIAFKFLA